MANEFQEVLELKEPASINDLNRMLKFLYEMVAGDGDKRRIYNGIGTPENNVAASVGSLYMRADGTANATLYVKESGTGATGWIAK